MHDYKKISDVIKTGKNAHFLVDATQAIGNIVFFLLIKHPLPIIPPNL